MKKLPIFLNGQIFVDLGKLLDRVKDAELKEYFKNIFKIDEFLELQKAKADFKPLTPQTSQLTASSSSERPVVHPQNLFEALAQSLIGTENLTGQSLKQAKEKFLSQLTELLNDSTLTCLQIINLFEEMKNKDGSYQTIHKSSHIKNDQRLLFFTGKPKQELNKEKFWHTRTYQAALALLKATCEQKKNDGSASEVQIKTLLGYVRTNKIINRETTSIKKFMRGLRSSVI